jgi:hypothetical protein
VATERQPAEHRPVGSWSLRRRPAAVAWSCLAERASASRLARAAVPSGRAADHRPDPFAAQAGWSVQVQLFAAPGAEACEWARPSAVCVPLAAGCASAQPRAAACASAQPRAAASTSALLEEAAVQPALAVAEGAEQPASAGAVVVAAQPAAEAQQQEVAGPGEAAVQPREVAAEERPALAEPRRAAAVRGARAAQLLAALPLAAASSRPPVWLARR